MCHDAFLVLLQSFIHKLFRMVDIRSSSPHVQNKQVWFIFHWNKWLRVGCNEDLIWAVVSLGTVLGCLIASLSELGQLCHICCAMCSVIWTCLPGMVVAMETARNRSEEGAAAAAHRLQLLCLLKTRLGWFNALWITPALWKSCSSLPSIWFFLKEKFTKDVNNSPKGRITCPR